jgi:hypothetical protein
MILGPSGREPQEEAVVRGGRAKRKSQIAAAIWLVLLQDS